MRRHLIRALHALPHWFGYACIALGVGVQLACLAVIASTQ